MRRLTWNNFIFIEIFDGVSDFHNAQQLADLVGLEQWLLRRALDVDEDVRSQPARRERAYDVHGDRR